MDQAIGLSTGAKATTRTQSRADFCTALWLDVKKPIVHAIHQQTAPRDIISTSDCRVSLRSVLNIFNLCLDLCCGSTDILSHIFHVILQFAACILDLESPNALSKDFVHSER